MRIRFSPLRRPHPLDLLVFLLVLAAAVRLCMVVFASPLVGYANNYDFVRSSTCTGVWQTEGGKIQIEPEWRRPVNRLTYQKSQDSGVCMHSSDNVFPHIAKWFHSKGDAIDFREISFWKFVSLMVALLYLLTCVKAPGARLTLAAAFYLVFGDMAVLRYFNTLYLEYSVIAGLFFSLAVCLWLASDTEEPRRKQIVFAAGMLLWLGFSKPQYGLLGSLCFIYLALVFRLRWNRRKPAALFVSLAVAAPLFFLALNHPGRGLMSSIAKANSADTFLGAVLPETKNRAVVFERWRLPPVCELVVGMNWYTPGFQNNNPCPEISHVSRIQLPRLFWEQPQTFLVPMTRAVLMARPLMPVMTGMYEDPADATRPRYVALASTSLTTVFTALPEEAYFWSTVCLMAVGVLGSIGSVALLFSKRVTALRWQWSCGMLGFGGAVILYSLGSSVFGDGYLDVQKHAVGFIVGLAFQVVGALTLVVQAAAVLASRHRPAAAHA